MDQVTLSGPGDARRWGGGCANNIAPRLHKDPAGLGLLREKTAEVDGALDVARSGGAAIGPFSWPTHSTTNKRPRHPTASLSPPSAGSERSAPREKDRGCLLERCRLTDDRRLRSRFTTTHDEECFNSTAGTNLNLLIRKKIKPYSLFLCTYSSYQCCHNEYFTWSQGVDRSPPRAPRRRYSH